LNALIDKIVADVAQNGPSEAHLQKVKEYMQKQYTDNQKENSYWMSSLDEYFDSGIDVTKGFLDIVNSLTVKDVQQFANDLVKQGNKATLILTAEE
jgi:zinc protease